MNTKLLDSLVQIIHSLTEDEQKFLEEKLLIPASKKQEETLNELTSLGDEPFVGMWQDREDLADSSQWVRQLRQQECGH